MTGDNSSETTPARADVREVREVDVHEAATLAEQSWLMLDVREHDEWAEGHMVGATHVPLGELDPRAIPTDVSVVAVCRSGNRSSTAAAALLETGHEVVNMAGGMKAWQQAGLPVTTDAGKPGTI